MYEKGELIALLFSARLFRTINIKIEVLCRNLVIGSVTANIFNGLIKLSGEFLVLQSQRQRRSFTNVALSVTALPLNSKLAPSGLSNSARAN